MLHGDIFHDTGMSISQYEYYHAETPITAMFKAVEQPLMIKIAKTEEEAFKIMRFKGILMNKNSTHTYDCAMLKEDVERQLPMHLRINWDRVISSTKQSTHKLRCKGITEPSRNQKCSTTGAIIFKKATWMSTFEVEVKMDTNDGCKHWKNVTYGSTYPSFANDVFENQVRAANSRSHAVVQDIQAKNPLDAMEKTLGVISNGFKGRDAMYAAKYRFKQAKKQKLFESLRLLNVEFELESSSQKFIRSIAWQQHQMHVIVFSDTDAKLWNKLVHKGILFVDATGCLVSSKGMQPETTKTKHVLNTMFAVGYGK